MKWRHFLLGVILLFSNIAWSQEVVVLKIDDAITPAMANYVHRGIEEAAENNTEVIVIEINTPGGLLASTREISGDILNSSIPIITYVYPEGARAASAGLFITLSGHRAVMADGTNMGAAHPVVLQGSVDSTMNAKMTNNALAFIRSIANSRNKNPEWAEKAIQESLSFTEKEALEKGLIDFISPNLPDLLKRIDGDTISTNSGEKILSTSDLSVREIEKSFSEQLTILLSDPNLMYVLLLIGFLGLFFEFFNPGAIFPGVAGGIALILSLYSMSVLPINYAGLALIILAIILFVLEIKIISHGILAIGGIISLFLGSIMLIQHPEGATFLQISLGVIITSTVLFTAFFLFAIGMGLRAQKNKIFSGKEGLIGKKGVAMNKLDPVGYVKVSGEIWKAESQSGNIAKGATVTVKAVEDLKLLVQKQEEEA